MINQIQAVFQYDVTLFLNDQLIQSTDDRYVYPDDFIRPRHANQVFKLGFTEACKQINREIFTDEVRRMLRGADTSNPSSMNM